MKLSLLITFVFFACSILSGSSLAQNRVVVVPLKSGPEKIDSGVPTVISGNGRVWMDRNLGASHVAESKNDYGAYGWLFQWGRLADGHQTPFSSTTDMRSTDDVPGHGSFILAEQYNYDWRTPQNTNLWQGVSGTNNPCPKGFRLPTKDEWATEIASWGPDPDAEAAFTSPLKLVLAGFRSDSNGSLQFIGTRGSYWCSTTEEEGTPPGSYVMYINDTQNGISTSYRAEGNSVRCIKN